jgi:hypothetical protein
VRRGERASWSACAVAGVTVVTPSWSDRQTSASGNGQAAETVDVYTEETRHAVITVRT